MQLLRPNQPNVNLREECSSEWSPLALMNLVNRLQWAFRALARF